VVHEDAQGAHPRTGAALNAGFELLASGHAHDLATEANRAVRLVSDRSLDLIHRIVSLSLGGRQKWGMTGLGWFGRDFSLTKNACRRTAVRASMYA
jgi:hypothetical protein